MARSSAAVASAILLVTVMAACGAAGSSPDQLPASVDIRDPAAYAGDLFDATNKAREAEGLAALEPSRCAADAAADRAGALVGSDNLTHAALDGVIRDCAPATGAAENLVRSAIDPRAVVDAWLESPGHRENLLNPTYITGAIGCQLDGATLVCSHVFLNAEVS